MSYKKSIKSQSITLDKVWEVDDFKADPKIKISILEYQSINKMYITHKTIDLYEYMFGKGKEPIELRNLMNNLLFKNSNFSLKGKRKGFESFSVIYLYLKCNIQDLNINGYSLKDIGLKKIDELDDNELGYIFFAVLLECKVLKYTFDYSYEKVGREARINLLKGKFYDKYLKLTRDHVLDYYLN